MDTILSGFRRLTAAPPWDANMQPTFCRAGKSALAELHGFQTIAREKVETRMESPSPDYFSIPLADLHLVVQQPSIKNPQKRFAEVGMQYVYAFCACLENQALDSCPSHDGGHFLRCASYRQDSHFTEFVLAGSEVFPYCSRMCVKVFLSCLLM